MRVLLVSEGRHELGDGSEPGALELLVRRLLKRDLHVECDRFASGALHAVHGGKTKKYFKRALAWMKHAGREGFDAVIVVIDDDDEPRRRQQFDDAQESSFCAIRRALGVAVREFDAWILADERSLSGVLGMPVEPQDDVERLSDPKQVCRGLLDRSERKGGITPTKMYAQVAQEANLDTLIKRCPTGFAPFERRVRALLGVPA